MFIDYAEISVVAGRGGNGSASLKHEKYRYKGGPDGGDGGNGGNVIIKAKKNIKTLQDLKFKKNYKAENGENGKKDKKFGKNGKNLIIKVPIGTIIKDAETGQTIADLLESEKKIVIANGGEGGRGNVNFKSSTNQTPRYSELGLQGEKREIILEIKLIADVGLIGLPNVGKSTLLSVISNAKPKIANYPFTTIEPNRGAVSIGKDGFSMIFADIPGLIEGAAQGKGLGIQFLKHIERTRLLVHLLDVTSENLEHDFNTINSELKKYSEKLYQKPQIIVINKMDTVAESEQDLIDEKIKFLENTKYKTFKISAVARFNLEKFLFYIKDELEKVLDEENTTIDEEPKNKIQTYQLKKNTPTKILKLRNGKFKVTGTDVEKYLLKINTDSREGLDKFQYYLKKFDINKLLKRAGIKDGDTVIVGEREFDFFDEEAYYEN